MTANFGFEETAISIPFKIGANGSVSVATDQKSIWSHKVRSVIGTAVSERVMLPEFGCRLNDVLWSGETSIQEEVQRYIQESFSFWLPKLTLVKVSVSNVDDTGQITIAISYLLPNTEETNITIGIVRLSGNRQISQVTL